MLGRTRAARGTGSRDPVSVRLLLDAAGLDGSKALELVIRA